jgi:hypothetical protein
MQVELHPKLFDYRSEIKKSLRNFNVIPMGYLGGRDPAGELCKNRPGPAG